MHKSWRNHEAILKRSGWHFFWVLLLYARLHMHALPITLIYIPRMYSHFSIGFQIVRNEIDFLKHRSHWADWKLTKKTDLDNALYIRPVPDLLLMFLICAVCDLEIVCNCVMEKERISIKLLARSYKL